MGARIGSQKPTFEVKPEGATDFSDGAGALELGPAYGITPDEWQAGHIRQALARRADGRHAARRVVQSVARQNGKNGEIEVIQLYKVVVQGRKILHTAHEVKTAKKAFIRLANYFETNPDLRAMVKHIRRTNGQEAIILHSPSCEAPAGGPCSCHKEDLCPSVEYSARSRGAARGYTVDDLFCDEAQEMTDEQLEALLPTISSAPSGDPQEYYYGTPPDVENTAEVFKRFHDNAHSKKPSSNTFYQEWAISSDVNPDGIGEDWVDLAYLTNPALGIRMRLDTVDGEHSGMSAVGFARERLGQWLSVKRGGLFQEGVWERGQDSTSRIAQGSPLAFGVEVSVNRSMSHIAVAGFRDDGVPHVEIVASRPGTGWLRSWFAHRVDDYQGFQLVIQRNGAPASGLAQELEEIEGVSVYPWGGSELGAWTGRFLDLVTDSGRGEDGARRGLAHLPQPVLDLAVQQASLTYLGGGAPMIDRRHSRGDATPLVAAIMALGFLLTQGGGGGPRSVYEDADYSILVL